MFLPYDMYPHTHTGKPLGQVHLPSSSSKACFTILSSKEWNVIINSLPDVFKQFTLSIIASFNLPNSLLTSILIA